MSIESILLLGFLVFPLLERLTRSLRERAARARRAAATAESRRGTEASRSARVPTGRPPVATRRLPDPVTAGDVTVGDVYESANVPPVPGASSPRPPSPGTAPVTVPSMPPLHGPRHPALERRSAAERVRAARIVQADAVARTSASRGGAARRNLRLVPVNAAELRRAVVLMAVLGPCAALDADAARR